MARITVVRQSIAAFALIRKESGGGTLWLAQWNANWKRFNLVGGHKRPNESFRACAIREVSEELGLVEATDFVAAEEPTARLEYSAWSHGAGEQTEYTAELFDVALLGQQAEQRIAGNPANRWLLESEILAKQCADGTPVSETIESLLTKANMWNRSGPLT